MRLLSSLTRLQIEEETIEVSTSSNTKTTHLQRTRTPELLNLQPTHTIEFPALAQMTGLRTLPASSQNRRKLHNLPIHQCPSNAKWGRKTQRREDHRQMQPYINQADRMKKKQDAEQRTASSWKAWPEQSGKMTHVRRGKKRRDVTQNVRREDHRDDASKEVCGTWEHLSVF